MDQETPFQAQGHWEPERRISKSTLEKAKYIGTSKTLYVTREKLQPKEINTNSSRSCSNIEQLWPEASSPLHGSDSDGEGTSSGSHSTTTGSDHGRGTDGIDQSGRDQCLDDLREITLDDVEVEELKRLRRIDIDDIFNEGDPSLQASPAKRRRLSLSEEEELPLHHSYHQDDQLLRTCHQDVQALDDMVARSSLTTIAAV